MKKHLEQPDLFSQNDRKKLREAFYTALNNLTDIQQQAVEDIEGPVMVLAGPGTGKTQVFAARFGYILDKTDTNINQIICLTYSEAGIHAMRERLLQFIGPAAHEAHIFTYHSFCNKVIQENPEYFFDFKKFKLASDLQRYELIEEILLELPDDNRMKRIIGERHYDIKRLDRQYEYIKKEEKNVDDIIQQTLDHVDGMHLLQEYRYKNSDKLKVGYEADKGKYWRTIDALKTYHAYIEKMRANQWIDYNDMVLEVKAAFLQYPDLLLKYQEQYLYFLIDEFQDTNAIQNNIVLQLCNFWERPNLFIVGDDDQAIYRFQGASEQNLIQIFKQYPSIQVYCITKNFRSTQSLLDAANYLIEKLPTGRIKHQQLEIPQETLDKINKKLIAADPEINSKPPVLRSFINAQHETLAIFQFIRQKFRMDKDLSEVAILSRRAKSFQDLLYLLELDGIPVNLRVGKDILEQPFVRHFLMLLRYLHTEFEELHSGEHILIQLMYLPYWGLEEDDVAMIAFLERKVRDRKEITQKILNSASWPEAKFKNRKKMEDFIHHTKEWKKELPPAKTLVTIIEDIFRKSGMLQWALQSPENTWHLRCINTLFQHIRAASVHKPNITLSQYLEELAKMETFEITIPIEAGYTSANGVNIISAHGAKGQEFESVWVMHALKNEWEAFGSMDSTAYKLPEHITQIEQTKQNKPFDERRLFYVAMTRAKKELVISWPQQVEEASDKVLYPSEFVEDVKSYLELDVQTETIDEKMLLEKMLLIQHKKTTPPQLINHQLIDEFLVNYSMSATDLNSYLDCPIKFYFQEILRVPRADNAHLGLGTSLHQALHEYFHQALKNKSFDPEYLVEFFIHALKRNEWYFTIDEFNGLVRKFSKQLPRFLEQNKSLWQDVNSFKLEYFIGNVHLEGIPLHGKIDQVLSYGEQSIILDFKSGQGDSSGSSKKLPPLAGNSKTGGDYWRQSLFYKILLDLDKSYSWRAQSAQVLFLQTDKLDPEKFTTRKYDFTQKDLLHMFGLIQSTYSKIKNHEFEIGCNKDDCEWCNFVVEREVTRTTDTKITD
ncbi:MAG: ATP-dependent DNA helicase [Saprospiraceae bacterium]